MAGVGLVYGLWSLLMAGESLMSALPVGSFTAGSSDVSTYKEVAGPGQQVARFFVTVPGSSGNPTLELALVDEDGGQTLVLGRFTATCTVTARRVGSDGSSGDYVCDVSFAEGSTSKFDLLGHSGADGNKTARWKVGVTGLGGHASVNVYWGVDDEV